MNILVEKGFRQLFGMEVKMLNRSDIDIAIYVLNRKLKKLKDDKLAKLEPNFAIMSMGSGYDLWNYKITIFDENRENGLSTESINTYDTAELAFAGLLKGWFEGEILPKFMQRNV